MHKESMIWRGVQIYCKKKSLLGRGKKINLIKLHFMQAWGVE